MMDKQLLFPGETMTSAKWAVLARASLSCVRAPRCRQRFVTSGEGKAEGGALRAAMGGELGALQCSQLKQNSTLLLD